MDRDVVKRALWTFAQAFLGVFIPLASGWLADVANRGALDLGAGKAALVSAVAGGFAAGLSAVKNAVLKPESPIR